MSLNTKITVSLLALIVTLSALFWWISKQQTELRQQTFFQQLHGSLASNLLKEGPLYINGQIDPVALEHVFHTLMVVNPSIEVYLLDTAGSILNYSAPLGRVQMQSVGVSPIRSFLADRSQLPIVGDNPREPGQQKIFSAAEVYQDEALAGYLYIVLGGDIHDAVAGRTAWVGAWRTAGMGTAIITAFGLVCGALCYLLLTRRLRRVDQAVSQFQLEISSNDASSKPIELASNPGSNDEIDRLAANCVQMSRTILEQVEQLTFTDQMRRQLVANVSHDLRTPLASLEGYLETVLLKGAQLSRQQVRQYVKTAHQSAQRLRRLINELFELARLEADDRLPQLEMFSIAELANDVVQKLRVIADKGEVKLVMDVQDHAHFAVAEIGLIERVLENLLINAIEHSPAGGEVRLEVTRTMRERVNVAVIDEGVGIAERELPHIFDRFYRPDHGADHRTDGAGLGLAIVKRIVELHNSSIEAISKPGRGSAFAFWLPTRVPAM